MDQLFSKFRSDDFIALVAVVGVFICVMTLIVARYWYKTRQADNLTRLKSDMINRGMSAEEIRVVLEVGAKTSLERLIHG
jgi:hypothetical protein